MTIMATLTSPHPLNLPDVREFRQLRDASWLRAIRAVKIVHRHRFGNETVESASRV